MNRREEISISPHPGPGRRQETRCWCPRCGALVSVEGAGCNLICPVCGGSRMRTPPAGVTGQQGSGRRQLYWEREGGLITRAPQRPPARPGGPLPGDRSYSPGSGRREEEGISQDASVMPTIWGALITGLGLGTGFAIINKLAKKIS